MIQYKNIIGLVPYFYKLSELDSIDIDGPIDFFIAEKLYHHIMIEEKELL